MVKNIDGFVSDLGKYKPSGKRLRNFVKNLNEFLKDPSFRSRFGFEKEKMSINECIVLLREIYPEAHEYLFQKPKIVLKEIKEVPEEMLEAFAHEAGAGTLGKIRQSEVKLGAFDNSQLIGFIAANVFKEGNVLNVGGVYVMQQYSTYGLGAQFIWAVIKKSRKMGLSGVNMDQMTWFSKFLMEKLKKRIESSNLPITIRLFEDEDYGFCAEIRFKKS